MEEKFLADQGIMREIKSFYFKCWVTFTMLY